MMTKLRKIILIPALSIVFISGFFSCGVDRWPEYAHQTALDTWMYDIMQQKDALYAKEDFTCLLYTSDAADE